MGEKKDLSKRDILIHILLLSIVLFSLNHILVDISRTFKLTIAISLILLYLGNYWAYLHNKDKIYKVTKKISFYLINFTILISLINIVSTLAILFDQKALESLLVKNIYVGKWIYFLLSFLTPYIVVISEPLTIMSGNAVFDPFYGFIIGYFGTILGIFSLFMLFRKKGDKYISRFIKEKDLLRYKTFVAKNETLILLGLFIFPILPDGVICGGAGLSDIKWKKFLLISAISKGFTVASYTLLVGWLERIQIPLEIWGFLGIVALLIVVIKVYKHRKKGPIKKILSDKKD